MCDPLKNEINSILSDMQHSHTQFKCHMIIFSYLKTSKQFHVNRLVYESQILITTPCNVCTTCTTKFELHPTAPT